MTDDGLTREQAAEILREAVPGAEVTGVVRLVGGGVSGAYEVLCADPEQNVVIKVYGDREGWRLSKEISVYRLLRQHGVTKIPRLLTGAGSDGLLGRAYLVMSKLRGVAADRLSPEMSDADLRSLYRQMGELVAQIHTISQEAYGYRGTEIIDPQPTNEACMKSVLARASGAYLEATGDRELYEAAREYVSARTELFALCEAPVLIHNDFHEGNIIVEQTVDGPVISGVIDVENAMAGDPIVDLSKTHSYSIRGSQVKLEGLFEGYGGAIVEWERRFRLFQMVHLFELWGFFYGREPGTPEGIIEDIRGLIAAG
ncbi:aminoglycoside phosphotransferase family protein [Catenulispora subtropica]|uniref:Aminoglycoside phosphotransferase domain-containing protein n=1 Tax=Catenulispora subtropica TaxID=450798 RepID=A0ABN2T0U3_9ACTN